MSLKRNETKVHWQLQFLLSFLLKAVLYKSDAFILQTIDTLPLIIEIKHDIYPPNTLFQLGNYIHVVYLFVHFSFNHCFASFSINVTVERYRAMCTYRILNVRHIVEKDVTAANFWRVFRKAKKTSMNQ